MTESKFKTETKRVNIADFKSRWEYTKATSRWHFDTSVNEDSGSPFLILGRFKADFSDLIRQSISMSTPTTMNNRLRTGQVPFTASLEEYDMNQIGLSTDHVLFHEVRKDSFGGQWPEVMKRLISFFGFQRRGLGVAIHVQFPGQVFPLHIDAFPYLKENQEHHILDDFPDEAARFTIQFKDWEWGHVWGYGNTYWKQWRAGEIAFHSWRDLPHCTANAGFTPRVSAQVTGIVTQRTRDLISKARSLGIEKSRQLDIDVSQIPIEPWQDF